MPTGTDVPGTDVPALPTDVANLRRAFEVAARSAAGGNHPFGAVLADPDGRVLLETENTVVTDNDCTGHAEINLVRQAARLHPADRLRGMTLYSSAEPCAMCSGAIYWSGLGRVVYGLSESGLLALTGAHPENPTMSLPCREVLARGQHPIEVVGPQLETEAAAAHADFWS
ncbi:nucleoside deaminase [Nocardia sp. BMG51109]|uniref:nucleoside deaminase n=1 Tax=Nocardia sp. BMG51109 TaxID=1056816 RepID=UPI0004676A96|nr:nucleoside deaminase [Nocardia sp. BMG51109]